MSKFSLFFLPTKLALIETYLSLKIDNASFTVFKETDSNAVDFQKKN